MTNRLTTSEYLKVTIPFMLSTATQPLLGAANTAIMGRMPVADYLAAVSLSVIFFNNIYWLFGFLRVATTAFSSQAAGSGKNEETFLALARPFILACIITVLFLLLYPYIMEWYTGFMRPTPNVAFLMRNYSDIAIIGAPFVLLNMVVLGWLMGLMIVKHVMFMQISMNLLNIVLSYVTVFHLGMDIDGVAWSMVIAQAYGLVVGLYEVYQCGRFHWLSEYVQKAKDFSAFGGLLRVQRDLMIRTFCLLTINNLFTELGTSMGTEILAANAVILELIFIISFFIDGMANGVSVFAGKAWGAKNMELFEDTIKTGMKCLWIFSLVASCIAFFFGDLCVASMTSQPRVIENTLKFVIYLAIHPLTAGVGLMLYGFYTSTGYTTYIRNMMIVAALLFAGLSHLLLPVYGNHGLWITYIVTYFYETVAYYLGMKSLKARMALQAA